MVIWWMVRFGLAHTRMIVKRLHAHGTVVTLLCPGVVCRAWFVAARTTATFWLDVGVPKSNNPMGNMLKRFEVFSWAHAAVVMLGSY